MATEKILPKELKKISYLIREYTVPVVEGTEIGIVGILREWNSSFLLDTANISPKMTVLKFSCKRIIALDAF